MKPELWSTYLAKERGTYTKFETPGAAMRRWQVLSPPTPLPRATWDRANVTLMPTTLPVER